MTLPRLLPAGSYASLSQTFFEGSDRSPLRPTNHSLTVTPTLGEEYAVTTSLEEGTLTATLSDTQLASIAQLELIWQAERETLDESRDRVAGGVVRAKELVEVVGGLYAPVSSVREFLHGDYASINDSKLEASLFVAHEWIDRYTRTVWSSRWRHERLRYPYEVDETENVEVLVVQNAEDGEAVEGWQYDDAFGQLQGNLPACIDVGYSYGPEATPWDISYCASRIGAHVVRMVYSAQSSQARSVQNELGLIQLHTGGTLGRPTGMGEVDAMLTQRRQQTWIY